MSGFDEIIDLTMFGCPMHKIKALHAARNHVTDDTLITLKINTDALDTIQGYLSENGYQCQSSQQDTLTSLINVRK